MYEAVTQNIKISVKTKFVEDQSNPNEDYYLWAYRITIENQGDETVQLVSRHWKITDGLGRLQEVKGKGVVGEQPVLSPGEEYSYASASPLTTPSGFMRGSYLMRRDNGTGFQAIVPGFSLDSPYAKNVLH